MRRMPRTKRVCPAGEVFHAQPSCGEDKEDNPFGHAALRPTLIPHVIEKCCRLQRGVSPLPCNFDAVQGGQGVWSMGKFKQQAICVIVEW